MRVRTAMLWVGVMLGMGCYPSDDELYLEVPPDPLAEQSSWSLSLSDSCATDARFMYCTHEGIEAITEFSSDDPDIVEITRTAGEGSSAELRLTAHRAGRTTIHVSARFDDGSKRSAEAEVEVRKADRVVLEHRCERDATRLDLFPAGARVDLYAEPHAGDLPLAGLVPGALAVELDAAKLGQPSSNHLSYELTFPTQPGELFLTSSVDAQLRARFEGFGPDDIDELSLAEPPALDFYDNVELWFDTRVGGERPCQTTPLVISTLTPEVCGSVAGDSTWVATEGLATVRPLDEGTCRLAVQPAGASEATNFEFTLPLADD